MTNKRNQAYNLPSEKEIERITKYFSNPNCKGINEGLMPNASEVDKTKYSICQSILKYKRINNISPNELAKKIKTSKVEVDNILFGRFYNFKLEELISYTEKLKGHMEVKVSYEDEKSPTETR